MTKSKSNSKAKAKGKSKKRKGGKRGMQSDTITPYMTFEVTLPSRLDKKRWSWKRENSAPGKVTVIKTGCNWK